MVIPMYLAILVMQNEGLFHSSSGYQIAGEFDL